jgi:gluconate 5-dehydrogenase
MGQALADAGARVAVTSRDRARAEAAAVAIGHAAIGVELDVRDVVSVNRGVEEVYGAFEGLDLLVNNAGIGMRTVNPRFITHPQPFYEVSPDGFRDMVATKVTGAFLVARAVVPRMLAAGAGRVVTISMNEQTMVRRGFVPYGPSGAAVEAMARVMAADLRDTPVRANVLLPGGATLSGMIPDDLPEEVRAQLLDPSIMGPPIVWLASEQGAGVHDERIVATRFQEWLSAYEGGSRGAS